MHPGDGWPGPDGREGPKAHTKAQAGDSREEAYVCMGRRNKRERQAGERGKTGRRHEAEDRFANRAAARRQTTDNISTRHQSRGRRSETGRRYTPRRDTGRQFTGHAAFCGLCGVAALGRCVAVGDPVSRVPCLCVISCAGPWRPRGFISKNQRTTSGERPNSEYARKDSGCSHEPIRQYLRSLSA